MLNGQGSRWRSHTTAVRAYDVATLAWTLVFLGRYLVQNHLYDEDRTGWLAVARIGMGWPLTALALLVTLWAVRRADRIVEPAPSETVGDAPADDPATDDGLSNKPRDEHGTHDGQPRLPGRHRLRD